ncbi:MAG: hypothetical protein ABH851_04755 [Methanobacteriota archaeon]
MAQKIIKGGKPREIFIVATGADTDNVVRELNLPPGLGDLPTESHDSPGSRGIDSPGFDFSDSVLNRLPLDGELKKPLPLGYEGVNRFYATHPKDSREIIAMGIRFPMEGDGIPETLSEPLAQLRKEAGLTGAEGNDAGLTARTIEQSSKPYLELSMIKWNGIDGPAQTAFANCANDINRALKQE